MTWHTVVVADRELRRVLGTIRTAGGIVISSCPCSAGFRVTFVTTGDRAAKG
jgi:hypothetical protein